MFLIIFRLEASVFKNHFLPSKAIKAIMMEQFTGIERIMENNNSIGFFETEPDIASIKPAESSTSETGEKRNSQHRTCCCKYLR